MWSLMRTGWPGEKVGLSPPQPLVSTTTRAPAATAVRTPWTTAADPEALVEVRAAEEDQRVAVSDRHRAQRPRVPGDRRGVEAGQVGDGQLAGRRAEHVGGGNPAGAHDQGDVVGLDAGCRRERRRPPRARGRRGRCVVAAVSLVVSLTRRR